MLPGLEVWVQSVPAGAAGAGGDVHYFSNCPQCIVSRIALADVSGHGEQVIAFADALRHLMVKHLTALAIGWHSRRGLLVLTNAGHPPPMLYRAGQQRWTWLVVDRSSWSKMISSFCIQMAHQRR